MANVSRPAGFRPRGEVLSQNIYISGAAVGAGDAVVLDSNGSVSVCATGGTIYSSSLIGVALNAVSAAGAEVLVADSPHQEFIVQADDGSISAQTALNLNYAVLGTSASGGESRQQLDASSGATTATYPLKALRLWKEVGNSEFGTAAKVVVQINNHQKSGGTGTAGV